MSDVINGVDFDRVFADPSLKYLFDNFLMYSRYIVCEKAIPSVVDGLLPTQRRFVLAMAMLGCGSSSKPMKSTTIDSYVTGNLSPQGSPYNVLVGQSQYYRVPQMLFKPSGNFGEPEANAPSADRYTENQLSVFAEKVLLEDLPSKPVVSVNSKVSEVSPYGVTYTRTMKEPLVLPARIPLLMVNGNNGIGVSLSQTWPMITFSVLLREYLKWLDEEPIDYNNLTMGHPSMCHSITPQDIFIEALKTGHGSVRLAPPYEYVHLNDNPRGRVIAVDVLALPPYVTINNVGDSFNQWKGCDSECVWESFRNNSYLIEDPVLKTSVTQVRMTFYLKSRCQSVDTSVIDKYMSELYSKVGLIQAYTINMTALGVDGYPREYTLETFFREWTDNRLETIRKMALAKKNFTESELHRTKVLKFGRINSSRIKDAISFVDNDDSLVQRVIKVMKENTPELQVSEEDAKAILNIPLLASSASARDSVKKKLLSLEADIQKYHNLSEHISLRKAYIHSEVEWFISSGDSLGCREIVNQFDDKLSEVLNRKEPRKPMVSKLFTFDCDDGCSDILVTTRNGCIMRVSTRAVNSVEAYRPVLTDGDSILSASVIHSSYLMFLTDTGRLLQIPAEKISYGICHTPNMLAGFSIMNKGISFERVIYMETFEKKPKYMYLTDGIFCKLVPLDELSTRSVIKMSGRVRRVCLVSTLKDLYGNDIDISNMIYKASRVGRLPKVSANSYIFNSYPSDRNIIEVTDGKGIIKRPIVR